MYIFTSYTKAILARFCLSVLGINFKINLLLSFLSFYHMKTNDEFYLSSDVLAELAMIREYFLMETNSIQTQAMLHLLEKVKNYIHSEENLKDRMMEEYAHTMEVYEKRFSHTSHLIEHQ